MKAAVVPDVHGKWQLKDVPIPKPRTDQASRYTQAVFVFVTDGHDRRCSSSSFSQYNWHEPVGEIVELLKKLQPE